jgi:Glucokinase
MISHTSSCDCSSYGAEVGCVGIKLIPTGGLYVTGGLTPKNIDWITGKISSSSDNKSCFLDAYHDKGRVAPILNNVPLLAVMTEDLGVRGAIKSAQLEYERYIARTEGTATTNTESDVQKYKNAFRVTLAFSLGVLIGVHVLAGRGRTAGR